MEEDKIEEIEDSKEKKPGVLSIISLSVDERENFIDYMDETNASLGISYLFAILGDKYFLKFLDVMAGETIKVPSRESTVKIINYIKIYTYCKNRGFTEQAMEKAAKVYDRRLVSVQRIIAKVDSILKKFEEKNNG